MCAGAFVDFPSIIWHPLIFFVGEFLCYDESSVQIRISSCNRVFFCSLVFPILSSKFFYLMSLAAMEILQIPWTLTDTAVEAPGNKMPFDQVRT